jgi:hypothetical protein
LFVQIPKFRQKIRVIDEKKYFYYLDSTQALGKGMNGVVYGGKLIYQEGKVQEDVAIKQYSGENVMNAIYEIINNSRIVE